MVNSKKILITGSKGQLGSSFKKISKAYNYNFIFTDKSNLDITNFDLLKEFFKKQIDIDADLWLIEIVSKEVDLTDLFLKQGL